MAVKCYVSVFACPTTKCINLQVIEGKSADAFVDGLKGIIRHKKKNRGFLAKICSTI